MEKILDCKIGEYLEFCPKEEAHLILFKEGNEYKLGPKAKLQNSEEIHFFKNQISQMLRNLLLLENKKRIS